jgi:SSS family solute:Na+ symporter
VYVATILVYLVVIVAIGVYFKRYVSGVEDFALAGRSLGLPILLGTLFASYIGGATVVGWTGSFYEMGFDWWFSGIGALLGIALATFVMAERCRKLEQFTVPDLLALRYDNRSRYVSAAMIIFGDIAIVTVQIIAIAGVLVAFTGLERIPAMVIGVVSFALISLFGGMRGVAFTDALQALLIFGGLLAGVIALLGINSENGGFGALPDGYFQPLTSVDGLGAFGLAVAALGTTAVSQSLIFSRIFSARDERTAKRGMLLLIPAAFLGYLFVALIGYGGRAILGPDVVPDDVFATAVTTLMPPLLGGLLLAVIIAAIVTSTNSILLSASVNLARDFYQQLAPRETSSVELRRVGQGAVVVFALLSFTLAVLMPDIVTAIVFAYTLYSAGLLVPLYAGFLWRGATPTAGMLSVIGGGGTALVWYVLGEPLGLPPIVPAIAVALAAIVLVSLVTQRPSREQLRIFDA